MGAELLGAGLDLASQLGNAINTGITNRANRRFAEKMFQWEVNANRENWRMQNEYNSPAAQMQRLEQAGLNPNLVYGNGATATGGNIGSASASAPQGISPRVDLSSTMQTFMDTKLRQVQIDQGKASIDILKQDAINKALQSQLTNAQIQKLGVDTDLSKFNLGQSQRLADISVQAAELGNKKVEQEIKIAAGDFVIRQLKNKSDLKEALTRMALNKQQTINLSLSAEDLKLQPEKTRGLIEQNKTQTQQILKQIDLMDKDGTLKELEIQLRKNGLNSSDPTLLRLLSTLLNNL